MRYTDETRIIDLTVGEFKQILSVIPSKLEETEDKLITIEEFRAKLGARSATDFPTRRTVREWMNYKKDPLPAYGTRNKLVKEKEALNWFENKKDTYRP